MPPVGKVPPPTNSPAQETPSQRHRRTQCRKTAAPIGTSSAAEHTVTREHAYTYDKVGNLTKETVTGSAVPNSTRTQAYNAANELCWTAAGSHTPDCAARPAGATGYTYDPAGNLAASSAGLSADYSLRSHMVTITPPGSTTGIDMEYTDATQDRRILAGDTRMAYNQLGLSAQGPTNGTDATWFVRDPHGTLVGMLNNKTNNPDLYYLLDAQGSIVATTDTTGNVVRRYAYEPYGEEINPSSTDANPWRYASGYHDTATGMLKFGARYYMPNLGRWTQPDPVQGQPTNPMSLNPYAYVGCNPVNNTDPTGRSVQSLIQACVLSGVYGAVIGALAAGASAGSSVVVGFITGCLVGLLVESFCEDFPEYCEPVEIVSLYIDPVNAIRSYFR